MIKKILCMTMFSFAMISTSEVFAGVKKNNKVVGYYLDKKKITVQDVLDSPVYLIMKQNTNKSFDELEPKQQEMVVKSIVLSNMINLEGAKKGITDKPAFQALLASIKTSAIIDHLIEQESKDVTDQMIQDQYKKFSNEVKGLKERKFAHILVADEKKANEIKTKLDKKNANFSAIAKEYSEDTHTKDKGGVYDFVLQKRLPTELGEPLFKMKKNAVSKPIKTEAGWHIIKLLDEKDSVVPKLTEVKDLIKSNLENEMKSKIREKLIAELEKKANFTMKD